LLWLWRHDRNKFKTAGHAPGGICLYREGYIFIGDTLFVGAVGRTDLPAGSIKQLVTSTNEKICTLPGNTVVWPGYDYGTTPSSTVQQEKDTNPQMAIVQGITV
jgi:glyoxylase-like metal-dependent hydrolase (beta-lactamase superfamily II)